MPKLTIDRDQNIIVNERGIAHHTGWLALNYHRMHDSVTLVPGHGYYNGRMHTSKESGQAVWQGTRAELTFALFLEKTKWQPSPR